MKCTPIVLFVLLLSSCDVSTTIATAEKTLEVDLDKVKTNFKLSEIVDSVYFVPLETHEACMIGSIGKILFHDSLIIVLDDPIFSSGRIYVFSQEGKFVRAVGNIGRGPEEYATGMDIAMADGNIQVLENSGAVVSYRTDGSFVGRGKLDFSATRFVFHNGNYHLKGGRPGTNTLFTVSKNLKTEASYFPHQNRHLNTINLHPFWVADGCVSFARAYDNTVYNLSEGAPKSRLFVDYLDKAISYEAVSKDGFDFESSKSKYAFTNRILENKHFMMIVTFYQRMPYVTLVDKVREKQLTYPLKEIEPDVTGESRSYPVAARDDGYFVYNVDPSRFFGKAAATGKRDERLDKILRTSTEFSNPILMMVKFKL